LELGNAVVASADLGFAKKGRNFAAKLGVPLAFVEKRRTGDDPRARATTVIGEVEGKDVVIVDDEVLTAGSVCEAADIVREHGARDVYLSFTHAVLVPPATHRLHETGFKQLVTTNTLSVPPEKRLANMAILSVAELLGEVILRAHEGRSVGELFNE
jgi:ribose-phosphate pyrophosphokinase